MTLLLSTGSNISSDFCRTEDLLTHMSTDWGKGEKKSGRKKETDIGRAHITCKTEPEITVPLVCVCRQRCRPVNATVFYHIISYYIIYVKYT